MPLRFTLVAALLLLVGLGLLASGIAVTSSLETSLMRRLDQQLIEASRGWAQPDARPLPPVDEPNPGRPPSNFFVRSVANDGTVRGPINDVAEDVPDLSGTPSATPTTVGSEGDPSKQWRVITVTNSEGSTTVGMSLNANQQTVSRLVVLQFYIGAAVLLALAVIAYFVVRRSLRPLREVETTAAAIAAGDLHRRVPEWSEKTEVGRLSAALNGMLSQIQRAFAATAASEEAARASEDRMRRFVADASHELRTPLTTIRGFAELYRQGAMSDISLLMNRIEGESARMGLLVEDLLMLARLDAQRPLDMRRVDLLTVAADAVHDAKAVSPTRDISLKVLAGPGIPEVRGDDARLRQVLANLVGNAVRHTPESASITVCVGTTQSSVLLEVQDTGPGLGKEEAAHVFERFYRADSSRTRESGGSGLGLSIVAALVAAHSGTVTVQSAPGQGATFRVELPRVDG
ncbi:two-component sensor histidine kinase [Rhodococcus sp. 05-2255-3B1]|uniref:sensor histidine kinase n=1 Tax=unclassified Rhodococcus (in: high G+C Gram-positive bacteria) TaxID=192944 RepID=UPI000B9BF443|nr:MULTISPECIES: HAMP domain-containing sensor histidine kinase [unclassified Rhodococcus (in: high G+C Gram-positive bacteria)]OZE06641.1 two-component sensor histidine kinase [Rhodococcus sp. 05-2255-3C]OZE07116.1 two-component sensor histidine kinase [Rhodococcus sp. 05-2255-3B1]OZE24014.1 two-component sensor histidine kinase [Rhodococcus sp. 05-2255-2A2]